MHDQEKRVLDLVKVWGTKMRAARRADWEQLPKEEQDKLSTADTVRMEKDAEAAYDGAQHILEKLEDYVEDYVEPLLDKDEFIPLTIAQRTLLRELADALMIEGNHIARLRNAYYGLAASSDTQEDFDKWDSEIIAEENILHDIQRRMQIIRNSMEN